MKTPINYGSVIATKGYNLKAKYILHVILHSCNSSDDESEKVSLNRIIFLIFFDNKGAEKNCCEVLRRMH